jgi:hypothetical protein
MIAIVLTLSASPVLAQNFPIRLTVSPSKPAAQALKYPLLPELRDQVPGNAALLYKKAIDLGAAFDFDLQDSWMKMPVETMPREAVRRYIDRYKELFALLDQAARCETCDWGIPERLRKNGIGALLPEIQKMREFANVLALRARLELAEGHPEKSLRALQTGFSLAHQIDRSTLIGSLVGLAISTIMFGQLDAVLTHPQTPNLYWSLTDLPTPFIDLRKPMQGERLGIYGTFPGMLSVATDPDAPPLTQAQIAEVVKAMLGIQELTQFQYVHRVLLAFNIRRKHEAAKKALVANGWSQQKVDAMPHVQVAMLHALMEYDQLLDETIKWQGFPYYQAEPHFKEADRRVRMSRVRNDPDTPAIRLAPLLLPAVQKVTLAQTRTERRIAALRCVEAIRLHAANHAGKWPATLAEIKDVPIPVDPITGKSFVYMQNGEHASLVSPNSPNVPNSQNYAVTYVLTLKP